MVSLRGAASVLGALGLALFLAGTLWALLTPPDPSCNGNRTCEKQSFDHTLVLVMFLVGGGLVLEIGASVMLGVHLFSRRSETRPAPPRAPRPGAGPRPAPRNRPPGPATPPPRPPFPPPRPPGP